MAWGVIVEVIVSLFIIVRFYTLPLALRFTLYTLRTAIIVHTCLSRNGNQVVPTMIDFYKKINIMGGFILLAVMVVWNISMDEKLKFDK